LSWGALGRRIFSEKGEKNMEQRGEERTLRSEKVQIERKTFFLDLKENDRGRFLRITEDVGGRRDRIIMPATGMEDFARALDDLIIFEQEELGPRGS
jgi:PurA ssDNA and RNA-binding protein